MRLETSARHLAGSPWPTFFTGQYPTSHGLYADFQWRPAQMEFAAPTPDWLNLEVFWRKFECQVPVVIYDVPFITEAQPLPGIEIAGWATHDKLMPASSYPEGLPAEVRARLGSWPVSYEAYGQVPVQELLSLRDEMAENIRRSTDLALWPLERDWRFVLICFSALHRGGPRLYDRSSIKGEVTQDEGRAFDQALRDLYVETDRAVGRLAAADLIVFSLHEMMANVARVDLLDEMLARVLAGGEQAEQPVASPGVGFSAFARRRRRTPGWRSLRPARAFMCSSRSRSRSRLPKPSASAPREWRATSKQPSSTSRGPSQPDLPSNACSTKVRSAVPSMPLPA